MPKVKPYTAALRKMMGEKSFVLSQAQTFAEMGMAETAKPLWASAGAFEERIAPLLEILGRELEAAVHRISAASCYARADDPSRAANLYRAALAGPLLDETRRDVEQMLADCLAQLAAFTSKPPTVRRAQQSAGGIT